MSAAVAMTETESRTGGAPARHIDATTARLDMYARSWVDVQQTRKALAQRELDDAIVASFAKAEQQLSGALSRTLRQHPLWPWLSQFKGLGGAHTGLIIGRIGDPRRFPGQRCTEGHYLPAIYAAGSPCPVAVGGTENEDLNGEGALDARADETRSASESSNVCAGLMLPPRPGTGVRSLWHYAGLHAVEDGSAPRKTRGRRCDWDPRIRASVMQQDGLADQIVRQTTPVYADLYRQAKARLVLRVPAVENGIEALSGDAAPSRRPTDLRIAVEVPDGRPLRLFEADRIARKVAAKAFLGDLLTIWKEL